MKLLSFLFCDDIRQENNQKIMLIGVYDQGIVINSEAAFPITLPMVCFFCRVKIEDGDKPVDSSEFKIFLDDTQVSSENLQVVVKDVTQPLTLCAKLVPFQLPKEGNLRFEIVFKSNNEVASTLRPDPIFVKKSVPALG